MRDVLLAERLPHAPAYEVRIGGKPASRELLNDVLEVRYRDTIDGLDSVELVVNNWDNATGTFKYQDTPTFDPPGRLEVDLGYPGAMHPMIDAEIVTLESRALAAGAVVLHVRGLNRLHRLRKFQRTRVYEGKKDSEIARQIATDAGLEFADDPSARGNEVAHPYLLQANQYDIVFLLGRARRIGYGLWVEGADGRQTLHFRPSPRLAPSPVILEWGLSLQDLTLTMSVAAQTAEVEIRAWDPMRKRVIVEKTNWRQLDVRGLPRAEAQNAVDAALKERREVVVDRPVLSPLEAKALARAALETRAKELAVARGTAIGRPTLRAGRTVRLEGIGDRYSGTYFITQTTHRSGPDGYVTRFVGRLEQR